MDSVITVAELYAIGEIHTVNKSIILVLLAKFNFTNAPSSPTSSIAWLLFHVQVWDLICTFKFFQDDDKGETLPTSL